MFYVDKNVDHKDIFHKNNKNDVFDDNDKKDIFDENDKIVGQIYNVEDSAILAKIVAGQVPNIWTISGTAKMLRMPTTLKLRSHLISI